MMKEPLNYMKNNKKPKQIKQPKIKKKICEINRNQNLNLKKKIIEPYTTKKNSNNNSKINNSITLDKKILNSFSFVSTISQENQTANKSLNIDKNNDLKLKYKINFLSNNLKKNQQISKKPKKNVKFSKNKKNFSKTVRQPSPTIELEKELDKFQNGINNVMKIIENFEKEYITSQKPKFIKEELNKITLNKNYFNKNKLQKNNKQQNNNNNININDNHVSNTTFTNNINSNKNLNGCQIKTKTNNNDNSLKIYNNNPYDRRINYGFLLSQKLKNNNVLTEINENGKRSSKNVNFVRKKHRNFSNLANNILTSTNDQKKKFFKSPIKKTINYILKVRKLRNKKGFSNSVHLESGFNNNIALNRVKLKKNIKNKSNIINSQYTVDVF